MKATLKFNLPEEQYQFESAVNGCQWHDLICDLDEKLRQDIKYKQYKDKIVGEGTTNGYLQIRKYILEEVLDRGLKLHE
jgi:hypothetical protein